VFIAIISTVVYSEGLLYDTERDLLAIAHFLVHTKGHFFFIVVPSVLILRYIWCMWRTVIATVAPPQATTMQ